MEDELNLSLPPQKKASSFPLKLIITLLSSLLIIGIANLLLPFFKTQESGTPSLSGNLSPEATQDLALKLEKQGFPNLAVETWKEYLSLAKINQQEQAKIWYRIGKLYQNSGGVEKALQAYYRSESHAKLPELEAELNLRIQESLEASGKFSALRYELSDRVEITPDPQRAGDKVLAEIGGQKITMSELDRDIENLIDQQLQLLGTRLTEEQQEAQKETLFKFFSSASQRQGLLAQRIQEELLYRKAREENFYEDPSIRKIILKAEKTILAQQFLKTEMESKINITQGDLQTYYDAHREKYTDPERAKISHILVENQRAAKQVLKKLKEGEIFSQLSLAHSIDEATNKAEGKIEGWIQRGASIPGIGPSDQATHAIFTTKAGEIAKETIKSPRGIHIIKVREREPKRIKAFKEVKTNVYRNLRAQKEKEIQEALFEELKEQYNVVIHTSKLQDKSSSEEQR